MNTRSRKIVLIKSAIAVALSLVIITSGVYSWIVGGSVPYITGDFHVGSNMGITFVIDNSTSESIDLTGKLGNYSSQLTFNEVSYTGDFAPVGGVATPNKTATVFKRKPESDASLDTVAFYSPETADAAQPFSKENLSNANDETASAGDYLNVSFTMTLDYPTPSEYVLTEDTTVIHNKQYYIQTTTTDGGKNYTPVETPNGSPKDNKYYVKVKDVKYYLYLIGTENDLTEGYVSTGFFVKDSNGDKKQSEGLNAFRMRLNFSGVVEDGDKTQSDENSVNYVNHIFANTSETNNAVTGIKEVNKNGRLMYVIDTVQEQKAESFSSYAIGSDVALTGSTLPHENYLCVLDSVHKEITVSLTVWLEGSSKYCSDEYVANVLSGKNMSMYLYFSAFQLITETGEN